MSNETHFKIKAYLQLAGLCSVYEDADRHYYMDKAAALLEGKDIDPSLDEYDHLKYFIEQHSESDFVNKTLSEVEELYTTWDMSDDRCFSSKQFKKALWDLYKIGIGKKKIDGVQKWVFLRSNDTKQKLK